MQHVLQDMHKAVFAMLDRVAGAATLAEAHVTCECEGTGRHEVMCKVWDMHSAIRHPASGDL